MFNGIGFIGTICVTCGFLLACFVMKPVWIRKGRKLEREEQEIEKLKAEKKEHDAAELKAASDRFR